MKRCAIYLRNKDLDPSSYYRVGQYLPYFNKSYIIHNLSTNTEFTRNLKIKNFFIKKIYQVNLYVKMLCRIVFYIYLDSSKNVDTIIIQRTILPRHLPLILLLYLKRYFKNKTIVWDFDDNIIQSGEISEAEKIILVEKAKKIIVTSIFLKETLPKSSFEKVILSPTTDIGLSLIYSDSLIQERKETYSSEINIIWVGTGGNLKFLYDIIEYLDIAASRLKKDYAKKLNLCVICNVSVNKQVKDLNILNILWTRSIVAEYIKKAHIGIMPLQDTYYTRGKAGFKLVQYMATGLPVIGTSVGYNNSVVDDASGFLISSSQIENWTDIVIKLSTNAQLWQDLSFGARNKFLTDFNPLNNINLLNSCINN